MALTATLTLSGMASGAYTVTARAVDAVGHVDAVGASFSFVVDLDAPTSRLVHSLTPFVNIGSITVGVNTSDALSSVEAFVRVDGRAWQSVSSTVTLSLSDGSHRIDCRGVDAADNAQPPPYDSVNVTVDTTPPVISVATGAVSSFNAMSVVSLSLSVIDATSTTVRGVLDGLAGTAVSRVGGGVVSVGVVADGNHTLVLSSEDAAGNVGAVVSVSWYTDRVAPFTTASLPGATLFLRDATAVVSLTRGNEAFPQLCVACWHYTERDGHGDDVDGSLRAVVEPVVHLCWRRRCERGRVQRRRCWQRWRQRESRDVDVGSHAAGHDGVGGGWRATCGLRHVACQQLLRDAGGVQHRVRSLQR